MSAYDPSTAQPTTLRELEVWARAALPRIRGNRSPAPIKLDPSLDPLRGYCDARFASELTPRAVRRLRERFAYAAGVSLQDANNAPLKAVVNALAKTTQPPVESSAGPATIWYHAERSYSVDGCNPVVLSREQHNILKAFLNSDVALGHAALTNAGVSNVAKTIKGLASKFPGTIRTPASKGEGYYIRVRSKTHTS